MPYQPEDATRFTRKADTSKKRRQWKHVYDGAIKSGDSEANALMQANGVVKRNSSRLRKRNGPHRKGRIRMR